MQSSSLQKFSLDLFLKSTSTSDENIFESPWSVFSALSLVLAGSSGQTQQQLLEALHLKDALKQFNKNNFQFHCELGKLQQYPINICKSLKNAATLSIANRIFIDNAEFNSVKKEYLNILSKNYQSEITKVSFLRDKKSAVGTINQWVEKKTNNKIKNLLNVDLISSNTRFILVNAVYFKASWETVFLKRKTKEEDFYGFNSKTTKVPMMRDGGEYPSKELSDLNARITWIPFKESKFHFAIILPNERDGITNLKKKLNQLKEEMKMKLFEVEKSETLLDLKIPRMRLVTEVNMTSILQNQMNIRDLFDKDKVDLSEMTSGRDLVVDSVIHKAFFEMDEEGAEAAAATAITMVPCCAILRKPDPIKFYVDHPFVLAICDAEQGVPLFIGQVYHV